MKTNVDLDTYYKFEKIENRGKLTFKSPMVYSNSQYFNSFDFQQNLSDITFLEIDVSSIKVFDTFAYIFIKELHTYCDDHSIKFSLEGATEEFTNFLSFLSTKKVERVKKERVGFLYNFFLELGENTKKGIRELRSFIEFFGETSKALLKLPFNLKQIRWEDFPVYLMRVGVNSIGICLLIVFLVGIIIGYVGAIQLARFGVGSFLAALVGIAVTRELSPLMVGIVIAGRSGSAFAAEIGTMKVSDEVDALTSFGFDKQNFIVIPRLLATLISLPVLVSISNIVGIIGGYLAGAVVLGLSFSEFQVQLLDSTLSYADVLGGIGKSIIFGFIIAVIGCFKGFQVSGGAESVGKFTTSSVVLSIFLIIFIDAIFAFII